MSRRKRLRRKLILTLLIALAAALAAVVQLRVSPYIRQVAKSQLTNAASNAMNEAVARQLRRGSVDYTKIVLLEKDESGHITALRTDMGQVAQLKAEIFEILDGLVDEISTEELGIPIGNLLLPELFAGRGARLPVRVVSLTSSGADFFSEFAAAGINQTLQTLRMRFCITVTILTPVGYESVDVESDVMLAQTVVVGSVPQSYLYLGNLSEQRME